MGGAGNASSTSYSCDLLTWTTEMAGKSGRRLWPEGEPACRGEARGQLWLRRVPPPAVVTTVRFNFPVAFPQLSRLNRKLAGQLQDTLLSVDTAPASHVTPHGSLPPVCAPETPTAFPCGVPVRHKSFLCLTDKTFICHRKIQSPERGFILLKILEKSSFTSST